MINSVPMPFKSPQEMPITGLFISKFQQINENSKKLT
jgi:hypothetical protein